MALFYPIWRKCTSGEPDSRAHGGVSNSHSYLFSRALTCTQYHLIICKQSSVSVKWKKNNIDRFDSLHHEVVQVSLFGRK